MSLAIASESESMNHYWTDSINLPVPQIHNVSYWNPHVYSLGLLRQSWNKNASSVLHIAIWLHTFWEKKKKKKAAMEQVRSVRAPHCRGTSLQQTPSPAAIAEPGFHEALSQKKNVQVIPRSTGNDWIKNLVHLKSIEIPQAIGGLWFHSVLRKGWQPCRNLRQGTKLLNQILQLSFA